MQYEFETPQDPEALLSTVVKSLVSIPEEVEIQTTETSSTTIFSIDVIPEDRGKIIGRGGSIFEALKTVFKAVGGKRGRTIVLEILE